MPSPDGSPRTRFAADRGGVPGPPRTRTAPERDAVAGPRRSLAAAGWVAFAAGVTLGVPVFLQMPPWTDLTLYQVAAAEVLRGGVLYRDVFDTNLPGFVAALTVIQAACGPDAVAVRAVDLAVVGLTLLVLGRWARRCGGGPAGEAWLWAGGAWFYLFTTEFAHCQRDVWMLLPAATAAAWRARRVAGPADGSRRAGDVSPLSLAPLGGQDSGDSRPPLAGNRTGPARVFLPAVLEGVLWGVAVWIKPHVVVPALAVWLSGLPFALVAWGRRGVLRDAAGLLAGGLVMGAAGVGLLVRHGAWEPFVEVMTEWNPGYASQALGELPDRAGVVLNYFPPWSLLLVLAAAVGAACAAEAIGAQLRRSFAFRPAADAPARAARVVLAALFAGWFVQALVLQRDYEYVHVPEVVLALAVLAGQGWPAGLPVLAWMAAAGLFWSAAGSPEFKPIARDLPSAGWLPSGPPAAFTDRTVANWGVCFGPPSPELRDRVARFPHVCCCASWAELAEVERFLRGVEPRVGDGDVLAFHDGPHPLYLHLDIRPGCRFMHLGTASGIPGVAGRFSDEVRAKPFRYVVSDLGRTTTRGRSDPNGPLAPGWPGGLDLPRWLPVSERAKFPWDQPVVFRAGRYCVHRVTRPVGEVRVPGWDELDTLGPGLP